MRRKKTVFEKVLNDGFIVREVTTAKPEKYHVVIFIGHDEVYGDVFKAYRDDPNYFTLLFGIKGDEFEDNEE